MKQRRSLGAALEMSEQKLAFIDGSLPSPAIEDQTSPSKDQLQHSQEMLNVPQPPANPRAPGEIETRVSKTRASQSKRLPNPRAGRERGDADREMLEMANLLSPLTTRLSPATAAGLRRAGLEQRLHGRKPYTVQEIVEQAIKDWLENEEYNYAPSKHWT